MTRWQIRTFMVTVALASLTGCATTGMKPDRTGETAAPAAPAAVPVVAAPAVTPAAPRPPIIVEPKTGMELLLIPAGCFNMGRSGRDNAGPHDVCISEFYLGKFEVTQSQWQKIMENNKSRFNTCGGDCPMEDISWNEIQEFIGKLNAGSDKTYRLPTEAEWEYAARSGGKNETWAGTNDAAKLGEYAWYRENSADTTHKVGQKRPNDLGLYDMSGNVYEWCQDWFDENYYQNSPKDNPAGAASGMYRVLRGGSWEDGENSQRTYERGRDEPGESSGSNGFRLALPVR